MKMLLNVNKNAKIFIECELHANVRFLALMNASSRYWSSIHTNECVFSRSEQQKVFFVAFYASIQYSRGRGTDEPYSTQYSRNCFKMTFCLYTGFW